MVTITTLSLYAIATNGKVKLKVLAEWLCCVVWLFNTKEFCILVGNEKEERNGNGKNVCQFYNL